MTITNPYTSQAISGYNTSPPSDDGSQTSSNRVEWAKHKTKLGDPIKTLAEAVNSQTLSAFSSLISYIESAQPSNMIINPDFRVAQLGTTFTATTQTVNNDDTYLLDQWILLAEGADTVDVSQSTTTVPKGSYSSIALDVETANRKFGILQIIEARDAARILGGSASLSFQARISGSSLTKLRAAIITWNGTADSVTSDIISAWGAVGVNPTLVANWTYENTPADLTTPTTSFQTYTVESVAIDTASGKNVGVFIWSDAKTTTIGDFLYIANVNLVPGTKALDTTARLFETEMALCQRHLEKS